MTAAVGRPRGGSSSNRLSGVDGLRAFAALWVVLFHIHAFSQVTVPWIPGVDLFMRSGSTGVSLFLVLSGFCLYLPFAAGRASRFRVRDFLLRRVRRLMPAYYASVALAALLYLTAPGWVGSQGMSPSEIGRQVVAHATMTHTFFAGTFYALNGAYWSLGLEWQLYLALPLLILGIRRFGLTRVAAAAIVCNIVYRLTLYVIVEHGALSARSLVVHTVLPNQLPGRWAEFVLGMVAAELFASGRIEILARRLAPLAAVLLPAAVLSSGTPLSHLLFGSFFFIILCLVLCSGSPLARVFSWPPLVTVGVMSYSLYLVHQPAVLALARLLRSLGASAQLAFVELLALLPFILFLAWLLFVTVERWTLTTRHVGGTGRFGALVLFPKWGRAYWRELKDCLVAAPRVMPAPVAPDVSAAG